MRKIKKIVVLMIIAALCVQSMPIIQTSAANKNSTVVNNTIEQNTVVNEKSYINDEYITEFNKSVDSIVDLSNNINIYNGNVSELVWEVDVKTTESKSIQALLSVFDNTNTHNYMTLYLKGDSIGFEA